MPKRKPMDDDGAAFVFWNDAPPANPSPQPDPKPAIPNRQTTPKSKSSKGRAINKLMNTTEKERQIRITVDLDATQHQALTVACAQLGKSKADIIRALVDDFINEVNQ